MPKVQVTTSDPVRRVKVGNVLIPRRFIVRFYEDERGAPDVEHVFEVREGVPQCREVHVMATEGGHEVRVSGLAEVRLQDVLEFAIWEMTFGGVTPLGAREFRISSLSSVEQRRDALQQAMRSRKALKAKLTDAMLRRVAEVYRDNIGKRPTKAVADAFDTSHRTAGRYVQRARSAGHLGAAMKGKAGEQ